MPPGLEVKSTSIHMSDIADECLSGLLPSLCYPDG